MTQKCLSHYWPFMRGIQQSPHWAWYFFMSTLINCATNSLVTSDLRRHDAHVTPEYSWWNLDITHFPHYWLFVGVIHRSSIDSPRNGQADEKDNIRGQDGHVHHCYELIPWHSHMSYLYFHTLHAVMNTCNLSLNRCGFYVIYLKYARFHFYSKVHLIKCWK